MGTFHVEIEIVAAESGGAERHLALVDTGASYLSLPRAVLERLGYRPFDTQPVIFATGQSTVWPVTEVKVRLEGRERTVGRRLVSVDAYLASGAGALTALAPP